MMGIMVFEISRQNLANKFRQKSSIPYPFLSNKSFWYNVLLELSECQKLCMRIKSKLNYLHYSYRRYGHFGDNSKDCSQ